MCFIGSQDKQRNFPLQYYLTDFKRIRLICEKHISFLQIPSAHLLARISTADTEKISLKFDMGDFYENLSLKLKLHHDRTKISGRLNED
jgi:hypothetical protein